jgi:formate dehydrogenase iron-sulfur subunit
MVAESTGSIGESMPTVPLQDESRWTAGVAIRAGTRYGFFTDTTLCIGCKACEVACKTWNALPAEPDSLSGLSYDNTKQLSSTTWRHVKFIERLGGDGDAGRRRESDPASTEDMPPFQSRWLMMSDVCKHCVNAPCLEACPTGALFRTEFDTVVVQQDICNGCGYCVPACPFGVVDLDEDDGKAHKCTLCYDRLKGGMEPACSKACPTDSIQFGDIDTLRAHAAKRVAWLHERGAPEAYLYGEPIERHDAAGPRDATEAAGTSDGRDGTGAGGGLGGLNAFFLLTASPETYNLPRQPTRASRRVAPGLWAGMLTAAGLVAAAAGLVALG